MKELLDDLFTGTVSRREFIERTSAAGLALPLLGSTLISARSQGERLERDVVIIGTGFGGSMTALTLARAFKLYAEKTGTEPKSILMLERGTWWTTPVETVTDKVRAAYTKLKDDHQPVQFWNSAPTLAGLYDLVVRCVRGKDKETGLYDLTTFKNVLEDGSRVSVLRASGVGGGSLVYANVTIAPPDFVFDDQKWPSHSKWADLKPYFDLARNAIGYGVVYAQDLRASGTGDQKTQVNTALATS